MFGKTKVWDTKTGGTSKVKSRRQNINKIKCKQSKKLSCKTKQKWINMQKTRKKTLLLRFDTFTLSIKPSPL